MHSRRGHRAIDRHSPLLALARARRKPKADEVVIVDGTLVPTRDFTESGIDSACGRATVLADGGYQGTGALIPHRRKAGQDWLEGWKAGRLEG
ncbi:hypothetical protein QF034_008145 [Streptomyces africanus]|uniref:Transposase n=1 Tax=Streptomyces africanus TaxID=231024 RepID=A0ABU0R580_9ACTN|nr:hypothetical protein [Streptomyces africanus]